MAIARGNDYVAGSASDEGRPPTAAAGATDLHTRPDVVLATIRDYAIFVVSVDRRVLTWNAGAELLLGYRREEIVGASSDLVFTPEDREKGAPRDEVETALREGRADDERWHVRKDSSRFIASGVLTAVRDHAGALIGLVKVMRDVTEAHGAQEALAQSEERYRLLVESIKDYAIFMLDLDGLVTSWSAAAERMNGYAAPDVLGRHFAMFFTEEDQIEGVPERELKVALTRGRYEGVGWRVRQDGSRFWADEIATAVYDEAGNVRGFSKITRNITERMIAEAERERLLRHATEANRIRDDFLATISHELRTPLNAILGWTHMLQEGNLSPDAAQRALDTVARNARAQAKLIEDLLDVSRVISGKLRLEMKLTSIIQPIAGALDSLRPTAAGRGVAIDSDVGPECDLVVADAQRLEQVLWNLLSNAIKFTPAGGKVTLTARCRERGVEIVVRDTGVGIRQDFLPYVFDRFRQADSSTTRPQSGLGLGLAIVRHVVELHGGTVSADSAGPGQGATFTVFLPTRLPAPSLPAREGEPSSNAWRRDALSGARVLAIDDDQDARELLAAALSYQGADVYTASSAREGIDAVLRHRPQIVLADLGMPEEDGYSFVRRLRQLDAPELNVIPAVAVTAYVRDLDRARALAAGFQGHVTKPVNMNELVAVTTALLRPHNKGYPGDGPAR